MPSSLAVASSHAAMQLMIVLMIGLTADISATQTVNICSEGSTRISGKSVNISSPSYPSLHRIRNNIVCSCHVTTGRNSNDNIRIEPTDISFAATNFACYATIELWNSSKRVDEKFCLDDQRKNFSNSVEFKSVFLTNITYQVSRPRSRFSQGKFLLTVRASRATNLLLRCTSFTSTSTEAVTQVISSTSRRTSTFSSTITSSSTSLSTSTTPVSKTTSSSSTNPIFSTVLRTTPISSTNPIVSTVLRTTSISNTNSFSSGTPIVNTTPIFSTIPSSSVFRYSSPKTSSTRATSNATDTTLDTMASSMNPQVEPSWSSTDVFTTITATKNDSVLWILIGVLLPIVLSALIATTVIVCREYRARKSKKRSVDVIATGNCCGGNGFGSTSNLLNNSYEMRSRTAACTEEPSTVVGSQEGSPPASSRQNGQTNSVSSNYTPMNQKGTKTFSKASLSTSVYADIEEIESQHAPVFRISAAAAQPVRGSEPHDNVYYNTATAANAANAESARRSDISAYETCYSPEIEGVTSLNRIGAHSPDVYSSISECGHDVTDLPTGSQKGIAYDQDETLYYNVVGQRGNGAVPRASRGEVTLVENQLYAL